MRKFYFLLLIFYNYCAFSQTVIKGVIKDEKKLPLPNVNIIIINNLTNKIIDYGVSDEDGLYTITFENALKDLSIKVSSLGYETIIFAIKNENQTINFTLKEKKEELDEVVIKSSPIIQKGDTLKYFVNSFSKEQDRSIGDVLKRIPGLEVKADGLILYQGKPINKYYIEGLDLLEGRYNLANENLPHKEVTQVQILENHQPIKALDRLKFSDSAALNIKLKNAYTVTGQASLGTGFSPLLWDTNITPMVFSKKGQSLVSYQANNVGDNVSYQLKSLTFEDLFNNFDNQIDKEDWLAIQQVATPSFSEKRWLDNNIHLLSVNNLFKLKKDYELRVNLSYLNDVQKQTGSTITNFNTPSCSIILSEEKFNDFFYNSAQTNITLQRNSDKNYFKNSLEFQGFWDSQKGVVNLKNEIVNQQLNNRFFNFSNHLKTIFPVGKQMLTLNSFNSYNKTPQTLIVNPGQYQELLSNNTNYEELTQNINLKNLFTNNSFSFTKGIKNITVDTKFGFLLENQNLSSELFTNENSSLSNEFKNNLDWLRTKFYAELQTQYKINSWRFDFTLPINFNSYVIKDENINKNENLNRTTLNPKVNVIYDINNAWKLNTMFNLNNQFGEINQLHYAYILQNYRSIGRINAPLPQIYNQNFTTGIEYKNPLKSFFWNLNYSNTRNSNNLIYQSSILPNGTTELQAIEQENLQKSHNFSTRINKNLEKLKTNIILNASFSLSSNQQILNEKLTEIQNENWSLGNKLEIDFTDWFTFEHQANWTFLKNKLQNQDNTTVTQQNHIFSFNFYPKENQYIALKSEYINNNLFSERNEFLFSDFIYRYTFSKSKIDLEFQINNLFNINNFRTINISEFSYIETNFNLRPRQILFSVRFPL
jgi:hypothetical protein